jgi:micrococcal nuclease
MYTYKATVERVVEGDTIDLVIDLGFKITSFQPIRLGGINIPGTYNVKKDSEAYKKGIKAKAFVPERITDNNNEVIVETDKDIGKFGRYIGIIRLSDREQSLNDELVEKGYAVYAEY